MFGGVSAMGLLNYVFYFFGVMLIVGGVFGNNFPMFLLGIIIALPPLLEKGLRRSERRDTSPEDVLSLIFDEKEKRVIEALIRSPKPLRLSEVAAITGLSKVTAYRLLRKLAARGAVLVLKDDTSRVKRYYINPKLRELFETCTESA
ncbi:helix-turn-helix domain-containing protein [Candidatus Bathyarchaeota archaeon]|nr:helix-turn-helix domain-containing protein [Candidatus Bathyarchaeota archaeon]